jgi:hypothetical protein
MSITQRFGICLMMIAIYGIVIQSIPESVANWQLGLIQLCLTIGILLFMMFPKSKNDT